MALIPATRLPLATPFEVSLQGEAVAIPYRVYNDEPSTALTRSLTGRQQMMLHCARFGQTMKKHLAADPQLATLKQLQALIDAFTSEYNHHRPHRSLPTAPPPPRSTPPAPKPPRHRPRRTPPRPRPHRHRRQSRISHTPRHNGKLHHIGIGIGIGIGRTYERTRVVLIVHGLEIRVVHAATGELIRALTLDPDRDYQPTDQPKGPAR
ncbi:integrase core domain-containing protein [Glycomyces tarimensis]